MITMHAPPDTPPVPEPAKDIPPDEHNPIQDPPLDPTTPGLPEPVDKPVRLI